MIAPPLDSFVFLAIGLGSAVAARSAFYALQSRRQLKRTLATLGQK